MIDLLFDLETIIDPTLPAYPPDDNGKERFPPAPYWQVVCAGLLAIRDWKVTKIDATAGDELTVLSRMLGALRPDVRLVSFNGRAFDVPVITARAFRHGIDASWFHDTRGARYRFSTDGHEDMMDELSDYGAARPGSLDVFAKLCGFPGKLGADGSNVAEWYAAGQLDVIASYCLSDVVQTAAVALRRWLVCGRITREVYVFAARSLLDVVAADDRVRPILANVDVERFLLGEPRVVEAKEGAAA